MASRKTPINIDAELEEQFPSEKDPPIKTVPVTLFGEEFQVRQDLNAFSLLELGDVSENTATIAKMMVNAIDEGDRPRFKRTISMQSNLNAEKLMFVFNRMIEVAAGNDHSASSPDSKAITPRRGARQLSAGS